MNYDDYLKLVGKYNLRRSTPDIYGGIIDGIEITLFYNLIINLKYLGQTGNHVSISHFLDQEIENRIQKFVDCLLELTRKYDLIYQNGVFKSNIKRQICKKYNLGILLASPEYISMDLNNYVRTENPFSRKNYREQLLVLRKMQIIVKHIKNTIKEIEKEIK